LLFLIAISFGMLPVPCCALGEARQERAKA
jgi:hypothetical protein